MLTPVIIYTRIEGTKEYRIPHNAHADSIKILDPFQWHGWPTSLNAQIYTWMSLVSRKKE